MSELTIHMFPCLADNYGYLLHDADSGTTAAVDTPDAKAILVQLAAKGWRLTHILNTHHHADHAGGNLELKRQTGCTIVGPRADAARIPGIDVEVGESDVVDGWHRFSHFSWLVRCCTALPSGTQDDNAALRMTAFVRSTPLRLERENNQA